MPTIKRIWIKNFKSYKDLRLELNKFNVVVGPNSSGKTNLVEFFKFFRKALFDPARPPIPYQDWWNYRNIVWQRDEALPITGGMEIESEGYISKYEVTFSGAGGELKVLHESLSIQGIVSIEREGQTLRIKHESAFIESNRAKLTPFLDTALPSSKGSSKLDDFIEQTKPLFPGFQNLLWGISMSANYKDDVAITTFLPPTLKVQEYNEAKSHALPLVIISPGTEDGPLYWQVLHNFQSAIGGFTLMRHPNLKEIREPCSPKKEVALVEDGSNLCNLLYSNWFIGTGRLPERIEAAITTLFPETQIRFELTSDGRLFMKVLEKGAELQPPSISDGFYKILSILTAIELKPPLLAIDEIENSLYARALEYLLDALKHSDITVIVTTHSPTVVDIVKPEDLLIAEKTSEGTSLKRIEDPKGLGERLHKAGITQSESWLYGNFM